jgi:SM-20-related protein
MNYSLNHSQFIKNIEKKSFYSEKVFSNDYCKYLINKIHEKSYKEGGIGINSRTEHTIRDDYIHWLDSNELDELNDFKEFILEIKTTLNRNLYLGLNEYNGHLTKYKPNGLYKPHYDNLKGKNNRKITIILYLNDDWEKTDGGQLRIHKNEQKIDVFPESGRIACFLSQEILHEVLPTKRNRYSITGWLN